MFGTSWTEEGVDTVFAATMEFPGGVVAQLDCGFRLPTRDELEAVGTEGSIFLDDPWHARRPVLELRRDDGVEEIELEPSIPTARARESADAIEGRRRRSRRDDALGQARAIDSLYRSAETAEAVSL